MSGQTEADRAETAAKAAIGCDHGYHVRNMGTCAWPKVSHYASTRVNAERAAERDALLAKFEALAEEFNGRAQAHTFGTGASRAYRDCWELAASRLRAVIKEARP